MRNPSKRLARWINEFGDHNLDIRYRKGSEAIVPNAISRRPDFKGEGPANAAFIGHMKYGMDENEWANHMTAFLRNGTEPPDTFREIIFEDADNFVVETTREHRKAPEDDDLLRKDPDGNRPYIPVEFRGDFLDRMHREYGHLGHPGLLGVVGPRAWWHTIDRDIREYTQYCEQCQCTQRPRAAQEREDPQTLIRKDMKIFERWAVDLIGILPTTNSGNKWIFTAVEYLTGWPIAVALKDAKAETLARVIHEEIAMHYGAPRELLSDNGPNFIGKVVTHYMNILKTKHRQTTPYHPRTNGKVENLNGTLGKILTKMLVNKPTVLWDQYLSQALFACRARVHVTSRKSPFFLLFGVHPRLPSDKDGPIPMDINIPADIHEERISRLIHARAIANEMLLAKAIKAMKLREDSMKYPHEFKEGDFALVRNEAKNKFESQWFGPFRIEKCTPLGTYRMTEPGGNVLKHLINGQRLVRANTAGRNVEKFWNSSKIQRQLRKTAKELKEMQSAAAVDEALAQEPSPPSFDEFASISAADWKKSYTSEEARKETEAARARDIAQMALQELLRQEGLDFESEVVEDGPEAQKTEVAEEPLRSNDIRGSPREIENIGIPAEEAAKNESNSTNADPGSEVAADVEDVEIQEPEESGRLSVPVETVGEGLHAPAPQETESRKRKRKETVTPEIERSRDLSKYGFRSRPKRSEKAH